MQVLASSTALQCLRIGVKVNRSQNICVNVDVLKGSYKLQWQQLIFIEGISKSWNLYALTYQSSQ